MKECISNKLLTDRSKSFQKCNKLNVDIKIIKTAIKKRVYEKVLQGRSSVASLKDLDQ